MAAVGAEGPWLREHLDDLARWSEPAASAAEGTHLDVYSEKSPLGEAIVGCSPGDATSYTTPAGKQIPVVIKDAKPFVP